MLLKRLFLFQSLAFLVLTCQSSASIESPGDVNLSPQLTTTQDTSKTDALKVAYVGNMGVCIERGEKTVIIDGFHQFYNKEYVYPSEDLVNQLINGTFKDFTPIEFSLFTHLHGDHFSGKYSKRYLENNGEGTVIGSYQIKEGIDRTLPKVDSISNRVEIAPYDKRPHTIEKSGIKVTSIQCPHSNPGRHGETQNIAFLVSIDNYKVLHVGDTDWDLAQEPLKTLDIKSSKIDLAILPYWMLLEGGAAAKVKDFISPKHVIATHIPPNFNERTQRQLLERFSNITLFTNIGEVYYYE